MTFPPPDPTSVARADLPPPDGPFEGGRLVEPLLDVPSLGGTGLDGPEVVGLGLEPAASDAMEGGDGPADGSGFPEAPEPEPAGPPAAAAGGGAGDEGGVAGGDQGDEVGRDQGDETSADDDTGAGGSAADDPDAVADGEPEQATARIDPPARSPFETEPTWYQADAPAPEEPGTAVPGGAAAAGTGADPGGDEGAAETEAQVPDLTPAPGPDEALEARIRPAAPVPFDPDPTWVQPDEPPPPAAPAPAATTPDAPEPAPVDPEPAAGQAPPVAVAAAPEPAPLDPLLATAATASSTPEPSTPKPSALEPSALEPSALEPSALEPPAASAGTGSPASTDRAAARGLARRWALPIWGWLLLAAAVVGAIAALVLTRPDDDTQEVASLQAQLQEREGQLTAKDAEIAQVIQAKDAEIAQAQTDAEQDTFEQVQEVRDQAEKDLGAAATAREQAEQATELAQAQYDELVAFEVSRVQAEAVDAACSAADAAGYAQAGKPDAGTFGPAAAAGLPADVATAVTAELDGAAIQAKVDECYQTGNDRYLSQTTTTTQPPPPPDTTPVDPNAVPQSLLTPTAVPPG